MIIKPIINTTKTVQGDKYTVYIYIYHRGKRKLIATKHRVKKADWTGSDVVKSHPNYEYINSSLKKRCLEIEGNYLKNTTGSIEEILSPKAEPKTPVQKKTTLVQFLKQYRAYLDSGKTMNKKGQPLSYNTIKSVKTYIGYFEYFLRKSPYSFEEINDTFFKEYVYHLRFTEEYGENTIAKAIKIVKHLMKSAGKQKLHANLDYEDFTATEQETEAIVLSEEEINKIVMARLPEHLRPEADRFYIAYNFLLRFSDSIEIDKRDIIKKEGKYFLNTIPAKTQDRVIIPFLPKTYAILKKYDFKLPRTTNQESNRKIKDIGQIAKINEMITLTEVRKGKLVKKQFHKYDLITTHTCRRSMATNLYLNGFDLKQIQLMGGWKSLTSLQRYLKVDKLENAKKAAEHPFFNR